MFINIHRGASVGASKKNIYTPPACPSLGSEARPDTDRQSPLFFNETITHRLGQDAVEPFFVQQVQYYSHHITHRTRAIGNCFRQRTPWCYDHNAVGTSRLRPNPLPMSESMTHSYFSLTISLLFSISSCS